jgi:hypothetical protein
MSQENVEIARRGNDAFRRGDWAAIAAMLDPNIVIRSDPRWPEQFIHGREAAIDLYRGIRESWGTGAQIEDVRDLGDRVLIRLHWVIHGPQSGVVGELRSSEIATYRHRRAILIEYFLDHDQALKAVGLEE